MNIDSASTLGTPLVNQRQQQIADGVRKGVENGTLTESDVVDIKSAAQDFKTLKDELISDGTYDLADRVSLNQALGEAGSTVRHMKRDNLAVTTPVADARSEFIHRRVDAAYERGQLDEAEMEALNNSLDSYDALRADLASDGTLTYSDREQLHIAMTKMSQQTYAAATSTESLATGEEVENDSEPDQ